MTEAEWLACAEPAPMLDLVVERASDRKLRLLGVACCRRIGRLLTDQRSRSAVDAAEQYADCPSTKHQLAVARRHARTASRQAAEASLSSSYERRAAHEVAAAAAAIAAKKMVKGIRTATTAVTVGLAEVAGLEAMKDGAYARVRDKVLRQEQQAQIALLHDIFGNPFRPVAADPAWRSHTAAALAESIYADRAFDRLPILSDALEDAGCTDAAILDHCRQPGEHVRGCWVVDLVLGRE